MTYSNVNIYQQIVYDNYSDMVRDIENNRTPKADGSGYIIKYDPSQLSFKKSMIVVVFAGMWIEAIFHQFMVTNHSKNQFNKHNKKPYKEKLRMMGILDPSILDTAEKFQRTRNELIHEKAFMDKGDIKFAQNEAGNAHFIVRYISKHLKQG